MARCPKCGHHTDGRTFCTHCGASMAGAPFDQPAINGSPATPAPPVPPPAPGPPGGADTPRPPSKRKLVVAGLVAIFSLIVLSGGIAIGLATGDDDTTRSYDPTSASTLDASITPGVTPSLTPTPSDTDLATALPETATDIDFSGAADRPDLDRIAATLDTYFSGVNAHDAYAATQAMTQDSSVSPSNPEGFAAFSDGIRSTSDDAIRVTRIADGTFEGQASVAVSLHFRSRQDPADGPDGQACTWWTLTHHLLDEGGQYLIGGVTEVTFEAC